jgi:AraC-like DNA-binding protein
MRVPYTDIRVEYMDTPERKTFDLRPDGLREVPMLGWCSYSHARPDLPTHHHPGVIEMHFLDRGRQVSEVEGQDYELHGGDLFITQPGEAHSTGGKPVEPCVLYWLNVRLPRPGQQLLRLPLKETAALAEALRSLPARQFRAGPLVKTLFDRLLELHGRPSGETGTVPRGKGGQSPFPHRPVSALRLTRMRQAMLDLLLEIIDGAARHAAGGPGKIMREMTRIIESRSSEDLRMEDLARIAGYSLSWFKMRFKEEIGISPRQFILRTKIDMACRRLLASDEPISKIAGDLGFPTSQYFATVFRRLTRVSPRRYRQEGTRVLRPSHRQEDGQL